MLTNEERKELNALAADPSVKEMKRILNASRKYDPEKQKLYSMRCLKKKYESMVERGEI